MVQRRTSSKQWQMKRWFRQRTRIATIDRDSDGNVFSSVSERTQGVRVGQEETGNACVGIPAALGRVSSLSLDRKRDSNWRLSPNSVSSDPGHDVPLSWKWNRCTGPSARTYRLTWRVLRSDNPLFKADTSQFGYREYLILSSFDRRITIASCHVLSKSKKRVSRSRRFLIGDTSRKRKLAIR